MPPLGKFPRGITLAAAMVDDFEWNPKSLTKYNFYLAFLTVGRRKKAKQFWDQKWTLYSHHQCNKLCTNVKPHYLSWRAQLHFELSNLVNGQNSKKLLALNEAKENLWAIHGHIVVKLLNQYHSYNCHVFTMYLVLSKSSVGGVLYLTCIPLPLAWWHQHDITSIANWLGQASPWLLAIWPSFITKLLLLIWQTCIAKDLLMIRCSNVAKPVLAIWSHPIAKQNQLD